MTTILSAFFTVDSRWATTMKVWPFNASNLLSASWTIPSDSASNADVASSSMRMVGCMMTARAMATRCFCPPLSCVPLSPTSVVYLSGKSSIKE
mmetsp:Transcript_29759/g.68528  ORF Transcript_29759/g.68528 Transcript_29759/m.68528 type:complete len:94 (-) Transcript_29759:1646-1927(-)